MKVTQLAVVTLWTEDLPASVRFYRDILGLTSLPDHGEQPHFDLANASLIIAKGRPVPAQNVDNPRLPIITLSVENLAAVVKQLQSHQIELPWGVEETQQAHRILLHDPTGNLIELAQFKEPV
jgi:catechol 2,3-dioxygenase-like lactoylglutathione lyase family enzyme